MYASLGLNELNAYVTISHTNGYVIWVTFNNIHTTTTYIEFVYIHPNYSSICIDKDPFEDLKYRIDTPVSQQHVTVNW